MARTKNPATEQAKTRSIRFPVSLFDHISQLASNDDRSFNQIVVLTLQDQLIEKKSQVKKESNKANPKRRKAKGE